MTETMKPEPKTEPKQSRQQGDRTPIRIKRLMFRSDKPTMMGIRVPQGPESKSEEHKHDLLAGIHGADKIEILHLPWMRVFRIARSRKSTHTAVGKDGKEYEASTWEPYGDPFHIPDTWAVSIPVEDA